MEQTRISRRELIAMLAAMGLAGTDCGEALAQDKNAAAAAGGKIVFENDKVRVIEHYARSRLGVCGASLHTHPPHLTIALTDVKAKVTLQGKEPFIAENKAGDAFWDPGGAHVVENVGSRDTRVYLVELKGTA
jgi:hypothetical protein